MEQQATGDRVEERDGRFYIEGAEVTEDEAREAGWQPEAAEEAPPADAAAPSVKERLRRAYAEAVEEEGRTKVIQIAPGIYHGLAGKYRPIDPELRRKLNRKADRTGERGEEADLNFKATLLADACLEILMRPEPGADYAPLVDQVTEFQGGEPVRYDRRLAELIGINAPEGATQAAVARLVFTDPIIFDAHYTAFSLWSTAALPDDEDEEESESEGRPT